MQYKDHSLISVLFLVLVLPLIGACSYFDTDEGLVASSADLQTQPVSSRYDLPSMAEVAARSTNGRVVLYGLDEPLTADAPVAGRTVSTMPRANRAPIGAVNAAAPAVERVQQDPPLLDLATSPFVTPPMHDAPAPQTDSRVQIYNQN